MVKSLRLESDEGWFRVMGGAQTDDYYYDITGIYIFLIIGRIY